MRKIKYDVVIDLRGRIISLFLVYWSKADIMLGFNPRGDGFFLDKAIPFQDNISELQRLLKIAELLRINKEKQHDIEFSTFTEDNKYSNLIKGKFVIALAPGAPWPLKRWPAHKFGELIDLIHKLYKIKISNLNIILIGGRMDETIINNVAKVTSINDIDKIICDNIGQFISIIKNVKVLVCNDSGPLHFAAIMNIPTVSLFGPTNYKQWAPVADIHKVVNANVSCSPCYQNINKNLCDSVKQCMESIMAEDVLAKIAETLSNYDRSPVDIMRRIR